MNWTARKDLRRDLNLRFTVRGLYEQQDNNYNDQNGTNIVVPGLFTTSDAGAVGVATRSGRRSPSVRQIGMFAGVDLEYKERYILNTQLRRDGSSLFGSANQWANYGRGSFAWRASEEPFWPLKNTVNDFKLRAAVGQAGNRPSFAQQYQTFNDQQRRAQRQHARQQRISGRSFRPKSSWALTPRSCTSTASRSRMRTAS